MTRNVLDRLLRKFILQFKREGLPLPVIWGVYVDTEVGIELTRPDVCADTQRLKERRMRDL